MTQEWHEEVEQEWIHETFPSFFVWLTAIIVSGQTSSTALFKYHQALLLHFANSLPGSIILVLSTPIIPLLAEPMDSSPLSSCHIQFVDMFCCMGIFILECPRHHLNKLNARLWPAQLYCVPYSLSQPALGKRMQQVWGFVVLSLTRSSLLPTCLFSSFRQFQESEATDPAALVPLQPSTWNREHYPG